ncbi:PE-PPE domain-containing protein [Mycobacterium sp. smrl_JER01]|uniref:PE-PPE domain-containing protein n=1 Tax=Mycobacterium sp. smrl_JER01 TaxID=3402633 RepID=UPI003AC790F0
MRAQLSSAAVRFAGRIRRVFAVFVLCVVAMSAGFAHATTALLVGGAGEYAVLTDEQMATALGGYFKDYTRVNVPFPGLPDEFEYTLQVGADNLYAAVYSTPGPKTIGGVSLGAPVVIEVLRRLKDDPNAPAAGELNAAMHGAMSPIWYMFSGVKRQEIPETVYDVITVRAEYDGIADWPDNWFNPLAVVNALMGAQQLHVASAFFDISEIPPQYITKTTNSLGGTTTSILIPTPILPLLRPMADHGVSPKMIEFLDSILRPMVDSGYWRFWRRTAATTVAMADSDVTPTSSVADLVEPARSDPPDTPAIDPEPDPSDSVTPSATDSATTGTEDSPAPPADSDRGEDAGEDSTAGEDSDADPAPSDDAEIGSNGTESDEEASVEADHTHESGGTGDSESAVTNRDDADDPS